MVLGLRDYVRKNRFPGVVLGLSGGIDSALTAAVAVDALGAARVRGVRLPSRFTQRGEPGRRRRNRRALLGMRLDTLPIEAPSSAAERRWRRSSPAAPRDVAEENLQARVRGAAADGALQQVRPMLVTTGNKSEMSVGYATLYGDMCGGYSVLKDIYKTEVFALAALAQRAPPGGALGPAGRVDPGVVDHQGAHRGAAARTRRTRTRCRRTRCSTPSCTGWSRTSAASQEIVDARLSRASWSRASSACSTPPSTSAARRRPA